MVIVLASHCCDLGWIPRPCVTCGSSLSGIFILAQWVFSKSSSFPPSTKNNILNSKSALKHEQGDPPCGMSTA